MKPEEFYQVWKSSPEVINGSAGVKEELTKIIVWYFACKNTEAKSDNVAVIRKEVFDFCAKYRWMRLADVRQAIEEGKINDERNISATHILGLLSAYLHSPMRKSVIGLLRNDIDNQLPEAPREIDPRELLVRCYDEFQRTKEVSLGTGKVYTAHYDMMEGALGAGRLREIAGEAFAKLMRQYGNEGTLILNRDLRIERDRQRKKIEEEWNRFMESGRFTGGGLLRNEVRRMHLAAWFESGGFPLLISEKKVTI